MGNVCSGSKSDTTVSKEPLGVSKEVDPSEREEITEERREELKKKKEEEIERLKQGRNFIWYDDAVPPPPPAGVVIIPLNDLTSQGYAFGEEKSPYGNLKSTTSSDDVRREFSPATDEVKQLPPVSLNMEEVQDTAPGGGKEAVQMKEEENEEGLSEKPLDEEPAEEKGEEGGEIEGE